jgi:hypothetical protein
MVLVHQRLIPLQRIRRFKSGTQGRKSGCVLLIRACSSLLICPQEAAQKLYESIDRLELYPGLQAEETKIPGPGAGLCPGRFLVVD